MTRRDFIDELLEWRGTPFHAHESVKNVGCDCVGLLVGALRELGHPLPLSPEDALLVRSYAPGFSRGVLGRWMDRNLERVHGKTRIGDVLLFNIGSRVQHVAVLVDIGKVIHAQEYTNAVKVATYADGWKRRLAGVYAVGGIR